MRKANRVTSTAHSVWVLGVLLSWLISLTSCSIWADQDAFLNEDVPETAFGLRPIYLDTTNFEVRSLEPRAIINGTGIFAQGSWLYVVDAGRGIHIFDNADPTNPIPLQFISIAGVTTATVSGDIIYADYGGSLLTIDISDVTNATEIDRDFNLFLNRIDYPLEYFGYFECYDPSLGFLAGWEEADLSFPECRSF